MNPDSSSVPQPAASPGPNPLLAHLNDVDESHAGARVDFVHPGTIVQPLATTPAAAPPPVAPAAPTPPPPATPPPAPRSPHNAKPIIVALVIIIILAALGGGAWWYFKSYRPAHQTASTPSQQTVQVTPTTPATLGQQDSTGKAITAGGATNKPQVTLTFSLPTTANGGSVTPEVEVEPLATAFTGQMTTSGSAVTATGSTISASVAVTGLTEGSYHWQARFASGSTNSSWAPFAAAGTTTADFVIDLTPPAAAKVTSVGGSAVKSGASSASTTNNQPTIAGTADPGSAIAINVGPDNIALSGTADSSGNWTVTPTAVIANGAHTLTIAAADAAGNTTSTTLALNINTVAVAPATAAIAPTGDDTVPLTLVGLTLFVLAGLGLVWTRRHGRTAL